MIYLSYDDLLFVARRAIGAQILIRDGGLLQSALGRPQASVMGRDAYETLETKAAALTHSMVRNRGLVDGNKRLGLAALIAFLGINGRRLTWSNDEAYEFIMDIAAGRVEELDEIADRVVRGSEPRRSVRR